MMSDPLPRNDLAAPRRRSARATPAHLRAPRAALLAIFFLSGVSLASWVARIPSVRDATGLSIEDLGLVLLAGSVGSVVGLVLAPGAMARLGSRACEAIMLSVVAVGLALVGVGGSLVPSVALVVVGLACFGLGNGALNVVMNVDGAIMEREIGRALMPVLHAAFSLGTAAGALLAAGATAIGAPVWAHLGGVAVFLVIGGAIAVRFMPPRPAGHDPRNPVAQHADGLRARVRANLAIWTEPRLLLISAVMLCLSFIELTANNWMTLAVVDGHGTDDTTGALVFSAFTIAMTGMRLIGGPLIDRFGRVATLRTLTAAGAIGVALFVIAPEPWVLGIGAALWAAGCALGFPVGASAAADDSEHAAARVGAVSSIAYLAFLAGPPLVGFVGQQLGLLPTLLGLIGLFAIAFVLSPAVREQVPDPVCR